MKLLPALSLSCAALISGPAVAQDPVLHSRAFSWEEIQATPTGSGGFSRPVVRQKTATLDELEMHVTALPPGKTTHPPHTHANEEIIIIREGTVDAFQNGKTTRVGPGSILFQASNEPHNLVNVGDVTAVYHVVNWASPGMKTGAAPAPAPPAAEAAAWLPSVSLPPALDRVLRDYEKAWAAKDAAALAALFAEDGFVMQGGRPPVRGRAAIQKAYAAAGGPLALRALAFKTEGSTGHIIGAFSAEAKGPDTGKFVLTLARAGERWLIASDMDNGNQRR